MKTFALAFSTVLLLYLIIGILFAVFFLWKGLARMDEKTIGTSWFFKALILPGTIALWPILLRKAIKR